MLQILFSTPVIASLLVAGCAAFAVSVVMRFIPDKRKLDRTMTRAQKALSKIRREISSKKATIKQLEEEVTMLQPIHNRLDGYHEQLTEMRLKLERKDMEEGGDRETKEGEDELLGTRRRPRV